MKLRNEFGVSFFHKMLFGRTNGTGYKTVALCEMVLGKLCNILFRKYEI
jgi:hypothetical protein